MIPACFSQEQTGVVSEAKFDLPCCCCYCWLFLWYQNQLFQAFTADFLPVAPDFWYHVETAEAPSLTDFWGSQPCAEVPSLVDCRRPQACGVRSYEFSGFQVKLICRINLTDEPPKLRDWVTTRFLASVVWNNCPCCFKVRWLNKFFYLLIKCFILF